MVISRLYNQFIIFLFFKISLFIFNINWFILIGG